MGATNSKAMGQRINAALAKEHKMQKDLASFLGVKDNVVSYFCSGTRTPNVEQIISISKYLKVSADYLLGTSDVQTPNTDIRAVCEFTGLSEKAVSVMHGFNARQNSCNAVQKLLLTINSILEYEDEQHPNLAVLEIISAMLFSDAKSGTEVVYINAETGALSVANREDYETKIMGTVPVLDAATIRSAMRHSMERNLITTLDYLRIAVNPAAKNAHEEMLHSLINGGNQDGEHS